ncbi:hypothetical protein BC833DRAFT_602809 [Globomyces pollinis-pini]|nr:hypothetical protein BC833DRAFT_602809 [Globomyces pollinis-pini]
MITEHPPTVIKDSTQKDIDSNEQDIQTQALEVLNAIFTTFNCQYTLLVPIIPDYKPALNQLLDSVDTTTAPKPNLVQVIKLLNNFHSYLNSFDEYMAVSEFVGCSAAMNELKTIYLELSKSKEIPTEIHMILKDEFITRFAKLKSILKQLEARMFILKPKECVINKRITHLDHIKFHDNSVGLDDFYSCLEALDLYQDFIEKWTDTITLNWIDELLIDNQICLSKSVNCWTLRIDKVDKLSESIETHSIQNLTELAQWISTVMFTKTHRPPDHLLLNWSKKVSESLKALFVKAGDTSITPEMIQCIQAFEVCLMDFDMLFHDYFPLIDMTLFKRELKRTFHLDTLTTCRDILKSSDTNTVYVTDGTERGGLSAIMGKKYGSIASNGTGKMGQETVDKNFQFKPCHVSVHIQSVMEIIYGILNEMKPQSIHNLESWYTVRDILDLFRGITQLRKNITTAQSMVIYNDCIYVVHHLSTLGYQYQDMLPEEFKFMTLIDNVYLYYDLGKRFLTQALVYTT